MKISYIHDFLSLADLDRRAESVVDEVVVKSANALEVVVDVPGVVEAGPRVKNAVDRDLVAIDRRVVRKGDQKVERENLAPEIKSVDLLVVKLSLVVQTGNQ